ncbi:MAG: alanine--tRNA ligase [Candidatus Saccharimonadales bacterium]
MNAQEIRRKYLEFYQDKAHTVIPRANLVPQDDATTLFTGSGMQPLLPYLLGAKHPEGNRLVNSQTCLRAEDIEEVGDNRHTTFFEMLGNWSLGDYFKQEQLPWFFQFLVDEVGLDPNRLYVTCFMGSSEFDIPKDIESAKIWQQLFESKDIEANSVDIGSSEAGAKRGMKQDERIFYYDADKNWWSRAGDIASMPEGEPGGPDSEVFYEFVDIEHDEVFGKNCHPNCDCGRFMEIGNSVFMQYVKTADGFDELPSKNVDFGGGLERIAAAKLNNPDVFTISLMQPIIKGLEDISGKKYVDHQEAMRVIADHLRASVFLALDGVTPSNKEQGYVMRRLMRRAIRFAFDLGIENDLIKSIVPLITDAYKDDFANLSEAENNIIDAMSKEEKTFRQTLRKGYNELIKMLNASNDKMPNGRVALSGGNVFKLYDTHGYPKELTKEIVEDILDNFALSENWQDEFNNALEEQRQRSRTATKGQFKGGLGGSDDMHKQYHTATHLMYRALREVLGDHVIQRGSNITDERLRFDFSHPDKMTAEEKQQVEDIVNQRINMGLKVSFEEIATKEALKQGAYGAFGDTYGDSVKVYSMSDGDGNKYSFEICGGPHVDNTSELAEGGKRFKITKEESSSAGVRRVKAELI